MEKFTKGKWVIDAKNKFIDGAAITSECRNGMVEICKVESAYFDGNLDNDFEVEQKANAHLIAAAPEMYAMLEDYVSFSERGDAEGFNQMLYVVKDLLAKARGE